MRCIRSVRGALSDPPRQPANKPPSLPPLPDYPALRVNPVYTGKPAEGVVDTSESELPQVDGHPWHGGPPPLTRNWGVIF